jgi:dissimilatory sulfite reductase (desulfoviridin) alpha/beta subunit
MRVSRGFEGKKMAQKMVTFTVEINEELAEALAQFVKRVGFHEFRQNAVDDVEAYSMRDAVDQVRKALGEAGFAPR